MTTYEKKLLEIVESRFKRASKADLVRKLFEMGVIDYTRCKVLTIRESVRSKVQQGHTKTDAMWIASEEFACSYEYVRKCVYYYQDINLV